MWYNLNINFIERRFDLIYNLYIDCKNGDCPAHLLDEWDYEKNYPETPDNIDFEKEYWWKCSSCGKSWKEFLWQRIYYCNLPHCSDEKIKDNFYDYCIDHLDKRFLLMEVRRNEKINPWKVKYDSDIEAWWKCGKCLYEWKETINNRIKGENCLCCSGTGKIIDKKLYSSFIEKIKRKIEFEEKSLESTHPALAAQWHPTKNGDKTPDKYSFGSHVKIWWLCPDCGHEWQSPIYYRFHGQKVCPNCKNKKS